MRIPALCVGIALGVIAPDCLSSELVAYFPFSGNANDESGNGNPTVVSGATLTKDRFGVNNQAYYFNGNNASISATITNQPLGGSPRTLIAWLRPEAGPTVNWAVISQGQGDCSGHMFGLSRHGNGILGFWGGCMDYTSPLLALDNGWCFVAVTYDSNVTKIFANGVWATHNTGALNTFQAHFWMGVETIDDGNSFRSSYRGAMDEVRLYDRALSTAEIESLYIAEATPSGPSLVQFVKVCTADGVNLTIGATYQMQTSSNLVTWSDWGAPFTATETSYVGTNFLRVNDWNQTLFRLQQLP